MFLLTIGLTTPAWAHTITLAWDAVADARVTGYVVRYGTVPGVYTASVQVGLVTQTTLVGLTASTYYFAVYARDAEDRRSGPSNEAHAIFSDLPPPRDLTPLHLQLTSPAIDAGVFLPVVPIDREGTMRPQGRAVDLGAYEAPPDTIPPQVSITSPLPGAQVTRQRAITISATATDHVRVTRVEIQVNGVRLCSRTAAPYRCRWTVPHPVGTRYDLQALAWDAAGNQGVSAIVPVRSR